jgi:GT2 family glycosyltransferase
MDVQLSFVTLSFNSEAFLTKCFDSIIARCHEEEISCEIIVIDNGSKDSSLDIINTYLKKYPDFFKTILLKENRGTTYTRNLGLNKAEGIYICILDSDTEMLEGSLSGLIQTLEHRQNLGIIAPQLVLPGGSIQNSVKKFPTFLHKLVKLPKAIGNISISDNDFYEDFPFQVETFVDSAISACWFFKKSLVDDIGCFDENIFYAPEDVDYSIRVYKAGKKILYYPKLKILHHTQQISHNRPFSKLSISHMLGLLYYFRKHGGWISTRKIYR